MKEAGWEKRAQIYFFYLQQLQQSLETRVTVFFTCLGSKLNICMGKAACTAGTGSREEDLAPKFISKCCACCKSGLPEGHMEWKVQMPLQVLWHSALLALPVPSRAPSLWDRSHCFQGAVRPARASGCLGLWTCGVPPAASARERSILTLEDSKLSHFFVSF